MISLLVLLKIRNRYFELQGEELDMNIFRVTIRNITTEIGMCTGLLLLFITPNLLIYNLESQKKIDLIIIKN